MVDSGNLMGVVTAGAGIMIMTSVASHCMRSLNNSYQTQTNRGTSYRRAPTRTTLSRAPRTSTRSRSSYRTTSSRRR